MVIFTTEEEAVGGVLQRDRLVVGIVDPRQFNEEEAVSKLLSKGGRSRLSLLLMVTGKTCPGEIRNIPMLENHCCKVLGLTMVSASVLDCTSTAPLLPR
jgi:hypothetical protein